MSAPEAPGTGSPPSSSLESELASSLQSPLLERAGFRHAFFTRQGGVSPAPFFSLNLSKAVGDSAENVDENRRRAATALGVEADRILMASQVHGSTAVTVGTESSRDEVALLEADAIVSRSAGVVCGVRTADCVPILLGSIDTGHAAAVHAGWRGCVGGVLGAAVLRLRELGARRIVAAIGPHISAEAFEVSEEVAAEIAASVPGAPVVLSRVPRPHVDLSLVVRTQLERWDIQPEDIEQVIGCTVLEPERFFSFRREGPRSGRQLSAIAPRG